jgi:serine O-acetyltransferase
MPIEEQKEQEPSTMNDLSQATHMSQLSQSHVRGCLRSLKAVRLYLQADLCRYHGSGKLKFLRHFLFTPGYQYLVWMRLTGWAIRRPATKFTIGILLKMLLSR